MGTWDGAKIHGLIDESFKLDPLIKKWHVYCLENVKVIKDATTDDDHTRLSQAKASRKKAKTYSKEILGGTLSGIDRIQR